MYLDVYIGYFDDPLFEWDEKKWNKDTWSGNCPHRKSPLFPYPAPFFQLIKKIENKEFEGKQVDWGGWVARVTKQQIIGFFRESYLCRYEKEGESAFGFNPDIFRNKHAEEHLKELITYINSLDEKREYALVASEL